jgi:hypothetical protein
MARKTQFINKLQITTGTRFMQQIDDHLNLLSSNIDNLSFSPSNEHGEGEQKIFEKIIRNRINRSLVVGFDNDLLVFAVGSCLDVDVLLIDTLSREHLLITMRDLCKYFEQISQDTGKYLKSLLIIARRIYSKRFCVHIAANRNRLSSRWVFIQKFMESIQRLEKFQL